MSHEPIDRQAYERGLALLLASREAATIATIPARIVERYGVVYCRDCGFIIAACGCQKAAASEAKDGGETDLARRVREARQQQGGR